MKIINLIALCCFALSALPAQECGSLNNVNLPCYDDELDSGTGALGFYEGDESLPLYPYGKRKNGCSIPGGIPGSNDKIHIKELNVDISFTPACYNHDICYYSPNGYGGDGFGISSRGALEATHCNIKFYRDLQYACLKQLDKKFELIDYVTLGTSRAAAISVCRYKADVLAGVVSANQIAVYKEAQRIQKRYEKRVARFINATRKKLIAPFNKSVGYLLKFTNPSKYKLDYNIARYPTNGSLSERKENNQLIGYTYTPKKGYEGNDQFSIKITDPKNDEFTQDVIIPIEVLGNSAPVAENRRYVTNVNNYPIGDLNNIIFTPPAFDPDGHDLFYSVVKEPSHGKITFVKDKKIFDYTPDFQFGQGVKTGTISKDNTDEFTYRVTDEYGKSDTATVSFLIYAKNHQVVALKTASSTGAGTITSDPFGISYPNTNAIENFAEFGNVTFTATPNEDSIFSGWDADCTSSGSSRTCTLLIDSGKRVHAKFDLKPESVNLSVGKNGNGLGIVENDFGGISCGDDCTESYPYGRSIQVVLNAKPDDNSIFVGWEGDCKGKEPCTLYMSQDSNVTAKFILSSPKILQVTNLEDQGIGSLRQAIIDANTNPGKDTINFSSNLKGTIILNSGELSIKESIIIDGPGANILSISGNNASRLLNIEVGSIETVSINGLTLKEGYDNTGNGAGGIMIKSGEVFINAVTMHHNSANGDIGGGGAIRKFSSALLNISKSSFYSNTAITAEDEGAGGVIRIDAGKATIVNSTLSKNSSAFGGAIHIGDSATLVLSNCTMTENTATVWGGGISNDGTLKVSNSIIAANNAPTDSEIYTSSLETTVFVSSGHNIFGENGTSGVSSNAKLEESDIILDNNIDTVIGPLQNNGGPTLSHMLSENGPAFAAGNNALYIGDSTSTDQRGEGYFRFMKDSIDIGAVERYVPIIMPSEIYLELNTQVKIFPLQGNPEKVTIQDHSLVSVEVNLLGFITIKGKLVGSTTIQIEDVQGNVSKILIEVSAADDNSTETPLSDDGTNTSPARNPSSGGGGCTYNTNSEGFDMTFLFIVALGLLYPFRRRFLK